MLGIYPIVSLTALGPFMLQLVGDASIMQLALSTAMWCCFAYMLFPFAELILLLSQPLSLSPKALAFECNFVHACIYYVFATLIICLIFWESLSKKHVQAFYPMNMLFVLFTRHSGRYSAYAAADARAYRLPYRGIPCRAS